MSPIFPSYLRLLFFVKTIFQLPYINFMASPETKKFTEKELQERLKNGKPLTREQFLKRIQEKRGRSVKAK